MWTISLSRKYLFCLAVSMKLATPTNLELQALSVLWALGEATVREVWESFPDGKERAYTTILTILQNLERKGLVRKKVKDRTNIYIPKGKKGLTMRPFLKGIVQRLFQGKPAALIEEVLAEVQLSWCCIDAETLRPARIGEHLREFFFPKGE